VVNGRVHASTTGARRTIHNFSRGALVHTCW